jgi:hypothetical protein
LKPAEELLDWLKAVNNLKKKELALTCYQTRSKLLPWIRKRIKDAGDDFDELAYYTGKLGAY